MKGEYEDIMYYRKRIKGRQVRVESPFGGAAGGGGVATEHGTSKCVKDSLREKSSYELYLKHRHSARRS